MLKKKENSDLEEAPPINSHDPVRLSLWVKAGGRCEFFGCNKYLLDDDFTGFKEINLADIAHIIGRSKNSKSPRGYDSLPINLRNNVENLMLLCAEHHNKVIDKKKLVKEFDKTRLLQYKKSHEERVKYLTSLGPESETVIIRTLGNIRGDGVSISDEQARKAVLENANLYPRYLLSQENGIEINLTGLDESDSNYWESGFKIIDKIIQRQILPAIEDKKIQHISIFSLARIPFMVYLGNKIGDKVKIDIYQKQRDGSEGWVWADIPEVKFIISKIRQGSDINKVAIILSLSGEIPPVSLPTHIDESFTIYKISPDGVASDRDLFQSKTTLLEFRKTYASLLRIIERDHSKSDGIHIFPAISISAAFHCGRERSKDVTPPFIIYDRNKDKIFIKSLEIR